VEIASRSAGQWAFLGVALVKSKTMEMELGFR
jgi:hypothetical protein